MYRKLNNELRRKTDKARSSWWKKTCEEIETLDKLGKHDLMYSKVRQVTSRGHQSEGKSVNDKHGRLLVEPDEIKDRWTEYIEELYNKRGKPDSTQIPLENEDTINDDNKGPPVLKSEITEAIRYMKQGKSPGIDMIPAELIKALSGEALRELENICITMYETGTWPQDFYELQIVPVKKKRHAIKFLGVHFFISENCARCQIKALIKSF